MRFQLLACYTSEIIIQDSGCHLRILPVQVLSGTLKASKLGRLSNLETTEYGSPESGLGDLSLASTQESHTASSSPPPRFEDSVTTVN
jgi:hypothetical protein